MDGVKSVLLVGVGGQGTILVSKLLTQGLIRAGYDVKMSEVHGMAQRGGSVSTQVRYGEKVYSPIIGSGQADFLVAFEKIEAVRYSAFLKPGGIAIINNYKVVPMPVAAGNMAYPDRTVEIMAENFKTHVVDAFRHAENLGNIRCMNVVLLGALLKELDLQGIDWEEVFRAALPAKIVEINMKALKAGLA